MTIFIPSTLFSAALYFLAAILQNTSQIYIFASEYQNFIAFISSNDKMASWLIVVLFAVGAVGFFVIGMSLTLMIKGHYIDGEISTNKNMQKLGIRCAVQETRSEDGTASCHDVGCSGNCAGCDVEHEKQAERATSRQKE